MSACRVCVAMQLKLIVNSLTGQCIRSASKVFLWVFLSHQVPRALFRATLELSNLTQAWYFIDDSPGTHLCGTNGLMIEMESLQSRKEMFQHKPLGEARHIRLIRLETPRHSSRPLQCQIHQVCLDDNPEYSAMSYAWDAERQNTPLICGGKQLLITPNCEKALRRFAKIPAGQVLWVDSICIDQTSTSERNHQVKLMGDIYSQAASVLVWLGERNQRTEY